MLAASICLVVPLFLSGFSSTFLGGRVVTSSVRRPVLDSLDFRTVFPSVQPISQPSAP